jgi:predicted protein tyrosine phosphatase
MGATTAPNHAGQAAAGVPSSAHLQGPEILVTTRWEAARWCHRYDSVLTVFAPWWHCDWGHDDHLIVEFEDRVEPELGAPTLSQVDEILSWAYARLGRSILVHCKAGQSRSTAAALAIACVSGMPEADALQHVYWRCRPADKVGLRPFIPNRRFLRHVDTLLGTRLVAAAADCVPVTPAH